MKKQTLTLSQRMLVAGTLFGMFFGAGNLIFPVHLGQLAGRELLPAIAGFVLTAVGIPILAVAAIGITHSDGLQALASRVGRGYGVVFTCVLYLTIGPCFAIPRCATTSFTTGIHPLLPAVWGERIPLLVFSMLFFALVLFFSLRPAGITVWIGKIINPVFLIFYGILVFSALLHPGASVAAAQPEPTYQSGAFFPAFIEGYGTMDAIAGLAFGIVVIDIVRQMGVTGDEAVSREVLHSGLLTGVLMAVIYALTILMGAQSRGLFEVSENGGIALAQIAGHYLGRAGSAILAVTITFACLKTSIGLVTSCAETFARMFPQGPAYPAWAVLFTVFSFAVSNVGLSAIISYSLPVLMLLYPLAITLVMLALCGGTFGHDRRVYRSVTAFTLVAALPDFARSLPESARTALHVQPLLDLAARWLPFYERSLGWVVPALLGLAVGIAAKKLRKSS